MSCLITAIRRLTPQETNGCDPSAGVRRPRFLGLMMRLPSASGVSAAALAVLRRLWPRRIHARRFDAVWMRTAIRHGNGQANELLDIPN
jgi:hypothetical protein